MTLKEETLYPVSNAAGTNRDVTSQVSARKDSCDYRSINRTFGIFTFDNLCRIMIICIKQVLCVPCY